MRISCLILQFPSLPVLQGGCPGNFRMKTCRLKSPLQMPVSLVCGDNNSDNNQVGWFSETSHILPKARHFPRATQPRRQA